MVRSLQKGITDVEGEIKGDPFSSMKGFGKQVTGCETEAADERSPTAARRIAQTRRESGDME
ncbi:hypothetical protein GCM10009060_26900 [Halorubrum trapanicum]